MNARPKVVEAWRDGAVLYDVRRLSWEEPGVPRRPITVRSFLTQRQAEKWIDETEERQAILYGSMTP